MILKIQKTEERNKTKDHYESNYYDGWSIFDNIKEVHELEEVEYNDESISGRKIVSEQGIPTPHLLKRLLVRFKDESTLNIYFDRAAYLMNDEGKTIQPYNN